MITLRVGSRGQDVGQWQSFLVQRGLLQGGPDGIYGQQTERATARFQSSQRLQPDGVVGPATLGAALKAGFQQSKPTTPAPLDPARPQPTQPRNDFYPPQPGFSALRSDAARQAVFGKFGYVAAPSPTNPEAIKLTDDWATKNIVSVTVPGLKGVRLGGSSAVSSGKVSFHRRAAPQLIALWQAWADAGLLDRVLTFDGAYNPRFVRGSHTALSNHAFGSAFDINAHWNPFKAPVAAIGKQGCVMELVALANQHGFYWGGHFPSPDGMHFEVASLGSSAARG